MDSLSSYSVRIEGDDVIVSVPEKTTGLRTPSMANYNPDNDRRIFVILGAGSAGAHAAEALREAGFEGRVLIVTQEDKLPYDRTKLSKAYLVGKASSDQMSLRSPQFYQEHDVEVLLNKEAVQVDAKAKTINFADGDSLTYDALLLATGGKPRQLHVPGANLQNIFTLRSFDDADRILASAQQQQRAVVIGSSFIGMETAAGLTQRGLQVTVVSPNFVPFQKNFGEQVGKVFQHIHEENGVSFAMGRKASRFEGNSQVEAVILDNGDRIAADLVIVGIGVQPATEFLKGVDLHSKDHSILVDEYLCVAEGLYAAGDIARYPDWRTNESIRIEHWRVAAQQGKIAAYNMAGKNIKYRGLPFFWTMQFNFPLRYVGHAEHWDEILIDGDLQQQQFIAFYIKDDQVLAIATSHRDQETADLSELMSLNQMPKVNDLRHNSIGFLQEIKNCGLK